MTGFNAKRYPASVTGRTSRRASSHSARKIPTVVLIRRDWLDTWRQPVAPTAPTKVVVAIDPADSGVGDETGIVASAMAGGVVSLVADASGLFTSDEWAMRAVRLALDVGASEISVEAFQSGTTYVRVVKEALARSKPNRYITVTPWPPRGSGRGKGDSVARAVAFLQAAEVGTLRLAGHHPEWEQQAVGWQPGMHQPDRVAAAVIGHDVCVHSAGARSPSSVDSTSSGASARVRGDRHRPG